MAVANDTFTRSVTDGWGTADTGGDWTIAALPADFDVNGTKGTVATGSTAERRASLNSTSVLDTEVKFEVKFPGGTGDFGTDGTSGLFAYALVRIQAGGQYARISAYVSGDLLNSVKIRGQDQTGTNLFADVDTGLDHSAGDNYNVKVQAQSSAPTQYRAKVWKVGSAEPGAWTVDTTSTDGPTTAGSVGIRVVRPFGNAQTLEFDNYVATDLAAGGTTFFQSVAGTLTSSGAIVKQTQKPLAGTASSSGALTKQTQKTLTGTASSSGALTKEARKTLTGTVTSAGALLKEVAKTVTGTLTSSGTVSSTKVVLLALVGTLTTAGALVKQAQKVLTGTVSPTGGLTKSVAKTLVGTLTTAGALVKQAAKRLVGTLTSSGGVTTQKSGSDSHPVTLTIRDFGHTTTIKDTGHTVTAREQR